ncbi:MAG: transglycosylase family protein, partial [Egibacteraceae bacterium]
SRELRVVRTCTDIRCQAPQRASDLTHATPVALACVRVPIPDPRGRMDVNPEHAAVSTRRRKAQRAGATVTALAIALTGALPGTALAKPDAERYHVKPADSLASIAQEQGIDAGWRRLFDANRKIDDPDLIEVGQRLRIPRKGEDLDRRALPEEAPAPRRETPSASRSSSRSSAPAAPQTSSAGVWDQLAGCESGGDWSANTGNGYYGGLQFSLSSWRAVGGSGYPHQASKSTQIAMGERLRAAQGWSAWPACSGELGL